MKETIKIIVIVLLVVVSVYFALQFEKVNKRMDTLNTQDSTQFIRVDEFDHTVNDLNLKFIGRGHHIQEFQRALQDMDNRLVQTKRDFNSKIDSLGYIISEFRMNTENEIAEIHRKLETSSDRITELQRKTNRKITDINSTLSRVNRNISKLDEKVKDIEKNKMDKPAEDEEEKKTRRW